jgi:hypothetical protein
MFCVRFLGMVQCRASLLHKQHKQRVPPTNQKIRTHRRIADGGWDVGAEKFIHTTPTVTWVQRQDRRLRHSSPSFQQPACFAREATPSVNSSEPHARGSSVWVLEAAEEEDGDGGREDDREEAERGKVA